MQQQNGVRSGEEREACMLEGTGGLKMSSIRDIVREILKERGMFFRFGLKQTKHGTIVNLYPKNISLDLETKIVMKTEIIDRCKKNNIRIRKVEFHNASSRNK